MSRIFSAICTRPAGRSGVSQPCYRYAPKRAGENEATADMLVGLTRARRHWRDNLTPYPAADRTPHSIGHSDPAPLPEYRVDG